MTLTHHDNERWDTMEEVAKLTMKGYTATAISKELSIPRKEVTLLQEDYRVVLSEDQEARDLARDHLHMMVKHYDQLINKFYKLIDDLDELTWNHQVAGQRANALKSIGELEAKRLDALQKAGLLESSELGDELAEAEEKREILINILRNKLCPRCQATVAEDLGRVTGQVEVVEVVDE